MTDKTTEALKLAEEAFNYRCTPMSNYSVQTSIDKEKKALAAIREALAEPVKPSQQADASLEPVAILKYFDIVPLQASMCLEPDTLLYAAPVSAEAIRAEALEEAAKVCEQGTGDAIQTETLKLLLQERGRIASVIRGLKLRGLR